MLVGLFKGDGIGPEIVGQAKRVLDAVCPDAFTYEEALVGAAAYRATGHPLPPETMAVARRAQAILFGAVGDFGCDHLPRELRPEQAILGLRMGLQLYANLRPAKVFPQMVDASPLRADIAAQIDVMILRESNGDVYFGEKGRRRNVKGFSEGYDIMRYDTEEVTRIVRKGFDVARSRRSILCSVDKANVLDTSSLWREVVVSLAPEYPDVKLTHMYVDNAAMQLVLNPGQFDVIVTGNIFGDILSDETAGCVGSIGLLPSATLGSGSFGIYEPIHGSAPDIAGTGKANPLATILSAAMMLRYSLDRGRDADRIEAAVKAALAGGARTADLGGTFSTSAMGDAVIAALHVA